MPDRPTIPTTPTIHSGFGTVPLIGSTGGSAYDPDAQNFFERASINDTTQKDAVNDMVVDLKSNSLWSSLDAIYPFVGGTSDSHSHNLKSSSYPISWNGTLTHDANGVKGDGSTGYGDTNFVPNVFMNQDSASFGCYINLADTTGGAQMGTPTTAAAVDVFQFFSNLFGTSYYFAAFGTDTGKIQGAHGGGTTGNFLATRNGAMEIVIYRNGSSALSGSGVSESGPPSLTTYLFARNNAGVAADPSNPRMAFACFGLGFSAAQASTFNTIVQNFETALGRS